MVRSKMAPSKMARPNDDFAVYSAMLKAGHKRKPKASPVEHAMRVAVEKLSLQRRYCEAFALWRSCGQRVCRRQQSCRGDANACLKRALDYVPRDVQIRARQAIIAAMPRNIGAAEREARLCMPRDLYNSERCIAATVFGVVMPRDGGAPSIHNV